ncbi:DUF3578 domain-containing protein [Terrabacter terrigena]
MESQLGVQPKPKQDGINDLAVEGRDATGLKSRTPWARVHSISRSPRATEGWYVVYLFSEAGDRVYASLNQGTTRWSGGEFRPRPKEELIARVDWARKVLEGELKARQDLLRRIDLQTKGRLGLGYEIGNVAAIEYPLNDVPSEARLADDFRFLTDLLRALYLAEEEALDLPGEPAPEVADAEVAVDQSAGRRARRQGFRLSVEEKLAIEKHAVRVATQFLVSSAGGKWTVKDVGATSSYDLDARRGDERLYVEVKGTTSLGEEVILTRNEVDLHRAQHPNNMLVVVSSIDLDRDVTPPLASGGNVRVESPWLIAEESLSPMAYRYTV